MNITIVTNTFKRETKLVERSIKSSLGQKEVSHVVLIDQNEIPLQLSPEYIEDSKLQVHQIKTTCVSTARNSAPIPQESDWIIFCDDDGFLEEGYTTKLLQILKEAPDLQVIAGSIVNDDGSGFYTPRHKLGGDLQTFRHSKLLMGSNFCVNYKVFQELNGFDDVFGAGGKWGSGEETDFAWNALFNNKKMIYKKELIVYHGKPYQGDLLSSIQKAKRYGVGKGALVSKWLIKRRKVVVLYELLEMLITPFIKTVKDIITLKPQNTLIHMSSLVGRLQGLILYLLK
jgi:hypothetical protein